MQPRFDDDLVSVIVPTFNSARFVAEAVDSVLRQTYENLELLITDDCSTDETWDIVTDFARRDPRVDAKRLDVNSGSGAARNASIDRAKGRYLAFIDSDDVWLAEKLDLQIALMREARAPITFAPYYLIDEGGRRTGHVVDSHVPMSVTYADMLKKKATMGCLTVMIDRLAAPAVRMPTMRTGQDYATWLGILREGGRRALRAAQPLACYRLVNGSISHNKWKKAKQQWRIYRHVERLSRLEACVCFVHYAVNAMTARRPVVAESTPALESSLALSSASSREAASSGREYEGST